MMPFSLRWCQQPVAPQLKAAAAGRKGTIVLALTGLLTACAPSQHEIVPASWPAVGIERSGICAESDVCDVW